MPRNNIKVLTVDQLANLNERYKFKIEDGKIVVYFDAYNRSTSHDIDKPFFINAKKIRRKMNFTVEAINMWRSFVAKEYSWTLIDVQNAVNALNITYQPISENSVELLLKKTRNLRIKKII